LRNLSHEIQRNGDVAGNWESGGETNLNQIKKRGRSWHNCRYEREKTMRLTFSTKTTKKTKRSLEMAEKKKEKDHRPGPRRRERNGKTVQR